MAEKRVEFASTKRVDEFREEVSELLRCIASILKEPEDTEDEWLSYADKAIRVVTLETC